MARYYVGYDCGTMGTKVAIFSEEFSMVADAYRPHKILYPKPGWAEMEAEQFYRAVAEGLSECLAKSRINPKEIRAISCSGVICGFVPIDKNWKPVGPYYPYLDNRAKEEAIYVSKNLEPLWEKENGTSIVGAFIPPMIMRWLQKNEKRQMAQTEKIVTAAHYVMGRLGGMQAAKAFMDWSHLSGWLLGYDARKHDWSQRQLEILGIPRDILPRVTKPWEVVGTLTKATADETGLAEGTPLVAGGGDMQQSCLGSGVVEVGVCSDVAGTASNFNFAVGKLIDSITSKKVLMAAMHTLEDIFLYWAIIPGGGLSLRWFRDEILNKQGDEEFYEHMNRLAEKVPIGSGFSLFLPYLQGRTNPVWPNASAGWIGLYGSSDAAYLWRAMLEAIAYEYYGWAQLLQQEGLKLKRIVGQGGGSKGGFWNQIKADMLNTEYVTLQQNEQAVLGNALLASYGVGDITDLRTASIKWVKNRETFIPNAKNHDLYMKLYEKRQEIINGPIAEVFEQLSAMHSIGAVE